MIHRLRIEGFRGVSSGDLVGFAPLTLVLGPTGAGKTAVLDALQMVAEDPPERGVYEALVGHPELLDGLVRGPGAARLGVQAGQPKVATMVELRGEGPDEITVVVRQAGEAREVSVPVKAPEGPALEVPPGRVRRPPGAPGLSRALAVALGDSPGRGKELTALLRPLCPELGGLTVARSVTSGALGSPRVELGGQLRPLAALSGGLRSLLSRLLTLSEAPAGALVLLDGLEEGVPPEGLELVGRAMGVAGARGVQVVATTQSLEAIDAVARALPEADRPSFLAGIRLNLEAGTLRSAKISGDRIFERRFLLDEDLR